MNRTFTRMATTLTGPALAAGILAAGLAGADSAQAQVIGLKQNCTTSTGIGAAEAGAPEQVR